MFGFGSNAINSITPFYVIIMTDEMINNMTPDEIKEYLEEVEADMILSSIDYQERDYVDCYLPA